MKAMKARSLTELVQSEIAAHTATRGHQGKYFISLCLNGPCAVTGYARNDCGSRQPLRACDFPPHRRVLNFL